MSRSSHSQLLTYFITYAVHKILSGWTAMTVSDYLASTSDRRKKEKKRGGGAV